MTIDHVPCYWVVETASNRFLRGSISRTPPTFNAGTETLVSLPTDVQIDPLTMRYDAGASTKRRPATELEMTAEVAARRDADADGRLARAEIAAMLELLLRRVLGRMPTNPERQAARTEYRQILRNLLD